MLNTNNGIILNLASRNWKDGRSAGAYRIASELRSEHWDIEVIDFIYYWSFEELKNLLSNRIFKVKPKFIGFSQIFTEWPDNAEQITTWLKNHHPDICIIFGSAIYSALPTKNIDYYFCGYSENAIKKFLKWRFSNGVPPIVVKDKNQNKIINAADNEIAAPLKNPFTLYEDRDFLKPEEWVTIEFSRGCKFQCKFCNFPLLGVKGDWSRDAESFEMQLKDNYDRFGVRYYYASDETFNDRTEKITKFADVVEKLNFEPYFSGFIRPDLLVSRPLDREELLRMNFIGHYYGVETFNEKSARVIGKGMNPDRLKEGILDVKKFFQKNKKGYYSATLSLIAGLPHETMDSLNQTRDWIYENWKNQHFLFFPFEIYRLDKFNQNSEIAKNYEKYGYVEQDEVVAEKSEKATAFRLDIINWKNQDLIYNQCKEFTESLKRNDNTLAAFSLGHNSWTTNIDEIFKKINTPGYSKIFEPYYLKMVEEYKNKKLSL
jgi:radical SAM superfamily enzyme YgiQ (UPF0313 family)